MIELKGIEKSFGGLQVLKGISLEIPYGEVTSIVGPSGAGKTTLLQIMGTLDRPNSGRVLYDNVDVLQFKDKQLSKFRNENIGFVFQFHRLLPEFTMLENVAMPALIGGVPRHKAMESAMALIKYMGLADRAGHKPAELSGGECQRTAVARALVNKPKVVLADEPSGSLDSRNRRELHSLFFDLTRETGVTFVIVTHDESLAAECDRVIHMRDGLIEAVKTHGKKK
ncbi:MAG: ABC transporter ATP-binding protein [Muribaculaceae bacterium]|nr:ABC transporter ATP-binding protein [Muribaculaceae bacterium]